jgi:hypothetical protein
VIEISFFVRGEDDLLVDAVPFVAVQHGSILGRNLCISTYRLVARREWHPCRWFLGRAPGLAARHRDGGESDRKDRQPISARILWDEAMKVHARIAQTNS